MKLKDAIRTLLFKEKIFSYNQLYTTWGENLDPEQVLQEYPRPQMKRDNYTILNGYWNYCISSEPMMPESYHGKILVPFSPESVLSGVNKQLKPDEILWYERILIINKKLKDKRCILHFGAVDQSCEVYINHQKVGEHIGGYLPFSIDITRMIDEGVNLLSLQITDVSETSYHSRGKQRLKRGGMFYTAQSGIWQTVWLEWVPELYIKEIKITPNVDDSSVRIELSMNEDINSEKVADIQYKIEIYDKHKLIQTVISRNPIMNIALKEFEYWSPENPYLYDLVIIAGLDRVESYFAMRKVEIKKDKKDLSRIYLNNKQYFQNGLLDQGYWPDGLYTAPCDEAMIFDIQKAKELGFNMLRKHIKIEPLRWYYHCDRLGILVWQDMVNGGEAYNSLLVGYLPTLFPRIAGHIKDNHYRWFSRKDKQGRMEWTTECEETVHHLYNCPCIVTWVPFNEGWGQFDAKQAYERVRKLDPTRLVDHASGWYDQKCGDFKSIHNYFHPLKVRKEKRPYVLSEFGGYACYISEHSYSFQIYGYRIYLTSEDLNRDYKRLMEKDIRELIDYGLSASVYTQLSDVEDEVNGLFTYDRKICKVSVINLTNKAMKG
ncbi:MAG TPA: glycoside hydrolase family 2 TIM barrel-domain containing protein [Mobilitalea sp.]|nr:glycoside hydrolase family 2 TIM barrel-domain containing protein [Mobilitalea sp.]